MPSPHVSEQQVIEALHAVPVERWEQVLRIVEAMKAGEGGPQGQAASVRTGTDLRGSPLIGIWADRMDITNSRQFARQLREQASHRRVQGKSDAAGQ